MATRGQQQQVGKSHFMHQTRRQRVTLQMIDRDQRFARGYAERLGRHQPHHHPADQPRPGSNRNRIDIGQRDTGGGQRFSHQRAQPLDMGAGGNFRHHPAIRRMLGNLACNDVGKDMFIARHHGGGGFIAA
jgi:hypothetical protein